MPRLTSSQPAMSEHHFDPITEEAFESPTSFSGPEKDSITEEAFLGTTSKRKRPSPSEITEEAFVSPKRRTMTLPRRRNGPAAGNSKRKQVQPVKAEPPPPPPNGNLESPSKRPKRSSLGAFEDLWEEDVLTGRRRLSKALLTPSKHKSKKKKSRPKKKGSSNNYMVVSPPSSAGANSSSLGKIVLRRPSASEAARPTHSPECIELSDNEEEEERGKHQKDNDDADIVEVQCLS